MTSIAESSCGYCKEEVSDCDPGVKCDSGMQWFHVHCQNTPSPPPPSTLYMPVFLSFSIYCLTLACEYYHQVYCVHSGLQCLGVSEVVLPIIAVGTSSLSLLCQSQTHSVRWNRKTYPMTVYTSEKQFVCLI